RWVGRRRGERGGHRVVKVREVDLLVGGVTELPGEQPREGERRLRLPVAVLVARDREPAVRDVRLAAADLSEVARHARRVAVERRLDVRAFGERRVVLVRDAAE